MFNVFVIISKTNVIILNSFKQTSSAGYSQNYKKKTSINCCCFPQVLNKQSSKFESIYNVLKFIKHSHADI